jgi:YfiH family protein
MTFPIVCHHWLHPFPWLFAGTTVREGQEGGHQDFRLPASWAWDALTTHPSFPTVVHAHQIHGARVVPHGSLTAGRHTLEGVDGHLTHVPGVLMAVTIADCVPIFLVAPQQRGVALLHAGWRGVAEGMLEEGVGRMQAELGVHPAHLHVHLGPAISGTRYEVGAEVFEALGIFGGEANGPLDLRRHLTDRAVRLGIPRDHIDVSPICTREDPRFYSHRGGDSGRQVALLGVRLETGGPA